MQLTVRDMDETRDIAAQIEQCMHLHGGLGGPEMRPGEYRQAQVDGRGVQRIDAVGQVHAEAFAGIEPSGLSDQPLGKLGVDTPIARLVGIRQRGTADRFAKPHVIELRRLCRQARFNVAQALAVGQLGERHDLIVRGAGQLAHAAVAVVARDNPVESAPGQKVHDLRE